MSTTNAITEWYPPGCATPFPVGTITTTNVPIDWDWERHLQHMSCPTFTVSYLLPRGIKAIAECSHCQKREETQVVPYSWLTAEQHGKIKLFCSHKCLAKYSSKQDASK